MKMPINREVAAAVVLLASLIALSGSSSPARAESGGEFSCPWEQIKDYGSPLRKLPRVHEIGRIRSPFLGIRGLKLRGVKSRVVTGSSYVSATLLARSSRPAAATWPSAARARLQQISSIGRPVGPVRSRRFSLSRLEEGKVAFLSLGFRVSGRPAFYRFDIVFLGEQRKVRAHFAEYLRVVRPLATARLGLRPATVSPGDLLTFRVEDTGTFSVDFGLSFSVDKQEAGQWVDAGFAPRGFINIGYSMPGGFAGRCQMLRIPPDIEPGTFRVRKSVEVSGTKRVITHQFTVAAPP